MLLMSDCLRCGCRIARDNGDAPFCTPCDTALEADMVRAHPLVAGDCRAVTRKGTPCQREAVTADGYCPSHVGLSGAV